MAQRMPTPFDIDPDDPRAPSQEAWDRMTPQERQLIVAMLPITVPEELQPPEGDRHLEAKTRTRQTLKTFFRGAGRRIYISGELNVYYPDERRFSPDVFAVLEVEPHDRTSWVVSLEGKGLDLALEVHFHGDRDKDFRLNVERYARLGIAEYFIFDAAALRLHGHRLAPGGRGYHPMVPQGGRFTSEVLGLDVAVEGSRLRFFHGAEPLPDADELIADLARRVEGLAQRHRSDAERAEAAERRAAALERELAAARAEIERLKGGG